MAGKGSVGTPSRVDRGATASPNPHRPPAPARPRSRLSLGHCFVGIVPAAGGLVPDADANRRTRGRAEAVTRADLRPCDPAQRLTEDCPAGLPASARNFLGPAPPRALRQISCRYTSRRWFALAQGTDPDNEGCANVSV